MSEKKKALRGCSNTQADSMHIQVYAGLTGLNVETVQNEIESFSLSVHLNKERYF